MPVTTIADRIKDLCDKNNTSMFQLEKHLGLGNGTLGKWGKSGRQPSMGRAMAVANALGVSVEYLLTGEGPQKNSSPAETDELDAETIELKAIWDAADEDERQALLQWARLLKKRRDK